jgi:hypothetical protein
MRVPVAGDEQVNHRKGGGCSIETTFSFVPGTDYSTNFGVPPKTSILAVVYLRGGAGIGLGRLNNGLASEDLAIACSSTRLRASALRLAARGS